MSPKRHHTDLTDAEWLRIAHLVPQRNSLGRPPKHSRREIVNAIRYYLSSHNSNWRTFPCNLPPYRMMLRYFQAWQKNGTWKHVQNILPKYTHHNHNCKSNLLGSSRPKRGVKTRSRTVRIRAFILKAVTSHPHDIARVTASEFLISIQGAQHHVNVLISCGSLIATGRTRAREYARNPVEGAEVCVFSINAPDETSTS